MVGLAESFVYTAKIIDKVSDGSWFVGVPNGNVGKVTDCLVF